LQCSNNPEVSELGVGAITVLPLADVDLWRSHWLGYCGLENWTQMEGLYILNLWLAKFWWVSEWLC
jgi:hypothetical protein